MYDEEALKQYAMRHLLYEYTLRQKEILSAYEEQLERLRPLVVAYHRRKFIIREITKHLCMN